MAIAGVHVEPLRLIEDERGAVLHLLREGSPHFTTIREVYFSELRPGTTKGWKLHQRMTQRLAVPSGVVRFTLYDGREESASRGATAHVELAREGRYALLVIPPGVWYAFHNPADTPALVANCADLVHDPDEATQRPLAAPEFAHLRVW